MTTRPIFYFFLHQIYIMFLLTLTEFSPFLQVWKTSYVQIRFCLEFAEIFEIQNWLSVVNNSGESSKYPPINNAGSRRLPTETIYGVATSALFVVQMTKTKTALRLRALSDNRSHRLSGKDAPALWIHYTGIFFRMWTSLHIRGKKSSLSVKLYFIQWEASFPVSLDTFIFSLHAYTVQYIRSIVWLLII